MTFRFKILELRGGRKDCHKPSCSGIRRVISCYKPENVVANQPVIDLMKKFAEEKYCTPAQISLAWVMHRPFVVPIPGMRSDARITENLGASEVTLSDAEYTTLTDALEHPGESGRTAFEWHECHRHLHSGWFPQSFALHKTVCLQVAERGWIQVPRLSRSGQSQSDITDIQAIQSLQ